MTSTQWAALERQARHFVKPHLAGIDAEAAIRAIIAWEWTNPATSPERRAAAWSRIINNADLLS